MRKAISIFFILLANIVILVHTVVPHHHHNKVLVAVISVLDDDVQVMFNHSHDAKSQHNNTDAKECAIYESAAGAVIRLQKDNSQDNGIFPHGLQPDQFVANITDTWHADPIEKNLSQLTTPYVARAGLDYCARALGLRAPPTC